MEVWYAEHKKYTYRKLEYSDFEEPNIVGHYTQVNNVGDFCFRHHRNLN